MKHWYAVQTKPRQEAVAEANLQRQGFETYLPMLRRRKLRAGKWVQAVEPLFPRYLFIRADAREKSLAPVRSTTGVAALVRFGPLLRPVPDEVVNYLYQLEDPATHLREDDSWPHQPGDAVEVLEGPFAGLTGVFEMPLGEDRAMLLITLLGRDNRIPVDRNALSAARDPG